jgi:hypothetical protein
MLVGFTTEELGATGPAFFTDGVSSETVDSFIANAMPGADPEIIKEYYPLENFKGE